MLPSARSVDFQRPVLPRVPRRVLVASTLVVALVAGWAVENDAEQVDSGWRVGTPMTSPLDRPQPHNPELHGILHQMLQESRVPILREARSSQPTPAGSSTQVAQRGTGAAGWRASGPHVSPSTTISVTAPRTVGPASSADHGTALFDDGFPLHPPMPRDEEGETDPHAKPEAEVDASTAAQADEAADETGDEEWEPEREAVGAPPTSPSLGFTESREIVTDADEQETNGSAVDGGPSAAPADRAAGPPSSTENGRSASPPAVPLRPAESPPLPPLTRQLMNLRARVRGVLKGYSRKPLNSRDHDCWEAMHGMLAYGVHSRILQGSPRGTPITAVGWLCYNKPCKGLTLLYVTPQGELRAKWGVGLQGHSGQFLAMLAQCQVSPDYPIFVGKNEFTIRDLIEAEKKTCYPKSELTFKLIALQHYLDLSEKWVNDQGTEWDIPRLIREEIAQPIRGAACGGTHRLSSLSLTVKKRLRRGEPLDGEYAQAAEFVEKYEQYAFRLQNRDGSLSTEWFRGRGEEDDIDRRIKTTGHILEWLCYTLNDDELRQQRTIRAVAYLANLMYSNYDHEWEVGPRSHAIHALVLYDERVFQPFDKEGSVVSYKATPSTANRSQRRAAGRK